MSSEVRSTESSSQRPRVGRQRTYSGRDSTAPPASNTPTTTPTATPIRRSNQRERDRAHAKHEFFTDSTNTSYIPSPSPARTLEARAGPGAGPVAPPAATTARPRPARTNHNSISVVGGGGKSFQAALKAALNNKNNNSRPSAGGNSGSATATTTTNKRDSRIAISPAVSPRPRLHTRTQSLASLPTRSAPTSHRTPVQVSELGSPTPNYRPPLSRSATRTPSPSRRHPDVPPLISPASFVSESSEPPEALPDIYRQIEEEELIAEASGGTDDDLSGSAKTSPDIRRLRRISGSPLGLGSIRALSLEDTNDENDKKDDYEHDNSDNDNDSAPETSRVAISSAFEAASSRDSLIQKLEREEERTEAAAISAQAQAKAQSQAETEAESESKDLKALLQAAPTAGLNGSALFEEELQEPLRQNEGDERSETEEARRLPVEEIEQQPAQAYDIEPVQDSFTPSDTSLIEIEQRLEAVLEEDENEDDSEQGGDAQELPVRPLSSASSSRASSPFEEVVAEDPEMLARDEQRVRELILSDRKAFSRAGSGSRQASHSPDALSRPLYGAGSATDSSSHGSHSLGSDKSSEPSLRVPSGWGSKSRGNPKWMEKIMRDKNAANLHANTIDADGRVAQNDKGGASTSISSWLQTAATTALPDSSDSHSSSAASSAQNPFSLEKSAFGKARKWASQRNEGSSALGKVASPLFTLTERSIEHPENEEQNPGPTNALEEESSSDRVSNRMSDGFGSGKTNLIAALSQQINPSEDRSGFKFIDPRDTTKPTSSHDPLFERSTTPVKEPGEQVLDFYSKADRSTQDDRLQTQVPAMTGSGTDQMPLNEGSAPNKQQTKISADSKELLQNFARVSGSSPAPFERTSHPVSRESSLSSSSTRASRPGTRDGNGRGQEQITGIKVLAERGETMASVAATELGKALGKLAGPGEFTSSSNTRYEEEENLEAVRTSATPAVAARNVASKTPQVTGSWVNTPMPATKMLGVIAEGSMGSSQEYGEEVLVALGQSSTRGTGSDMSNAPTRDLHALARTAPKLPRSALASIIEHAKRKNRGEEGPEGDETLQLDESTIQSLEGLLESEERAAVLAFQASGQPDIMQPPTSLPVMDVQIDHEPVLQDSGKPSLRQETQASYLPPEEKITANPFSRGFTRITRVFSGDKSDSVNKASDINRASTKKKADTIKKAHPTKQQLERRLQPLAEPPEKVVKKEPKTTSAAEPTTKNTNDFKGTANDFTAAVQTKPANSQKQAPVNAATASKPRKAKKAVAVLAPDEECDQAGEFHDFIWPCENCRRRSRMKPRSEDDTIGVVQWQTIQIPRLWRWRSTSDSTIGTMTVKKGAAARASGQSSEVARLRQLQSWIPQLTLLGWLVLLIGVYAVAEQRVTAAYTPPFYATEMKGYGVEADAPHPPFVLMKLCWRSTLGVVVERVWFAICVFLRAVAAVLQVDPGIFGHEGDHAMFSGERPRWIFTDVWEPAVGLGAGLPGEAGPEIDFGPDGGWFGGGRG